MQVLNNIQAIYIVTTVPLITKEYLTKEMCAQENSSLTLCWSRDANDQAKGGKAYNSLNALRMMELGAVPTDISVPADSKNELRGMTTFLSEE
jgi:hypothetical protein